jgi:uncharacterized repeat protein (TIGR01451 family)
MNQRLLVVAIAAGTLLATATRAETGEGLSARLEALHVIVQKDGKESLAATSRAQPGELLEYRAHYRNTGKAPARQVLASLPIPVGETVFVIGSAYPSGAEASTDGRHFEPIPLKRWVVQPDGRRELRPVPAAEYRSLRWRLGELAPGQAVTVGARVQVVAVEGGQR